MGVAANGQLVFARPVVLRTPTVAWTQTNGHGSPCLGKADCGLFAVAGGQLAVCCVSGGVAFAGGYTVDSSAVPARAAVGRDNVTGELVLMAQRIVVAGEVTAPATTTTAMPTTTTTGNINQGRFDWMAEPTTKDRDEARAVLADDTGLVWLVGWTAKGQSNQNADRAMFVQRVETAAQPLAFAGLHFVDSTDDDQPQAAALSVRSSAVYVVGSTRGASLSNQNSAGGMDMVLFKMNGPTRTSLGLSWLRLLGSTANETGYAVAVQGADAGEEAVFVAGTTDGALPNYANARTADGAPTLDMFVARYDSAGNKAYHVQLGSNGTEQPWALMMRDDTLFMAGLASADLATGAVRPAGASQVFLLALQAADGQPGAFTFVAPYVLPARRDLGVHMATDRQQGHLYLAVHVQTTNQQDQVLVTKHTFGGAEVWSHLRSSTTNDTPEGIALDSNGNIYVCNAGGEKK